MTTSPLTRRSCPPVSGTRDWRLITLAGAALALAGGAGCTEPEEEIPPAEVKTVEHYGITLDESATSKEVVYVLLRSLGDDFRASQPEAPDLDKQKAAMDLTYSLAAFSMIEQRILGTINIDRSAENKITSLGEDRDEKLYEFTKMWTPIVSHYVGSFDEDFEAFAAKVWTLTSLDGKTAHVYYDVCHDPSVTELADRQTATLDVELVREAAGVQSFWRVARIDYLGQTPCRARIIEAPGMKLAESSTPREVATALLEALRHQIEMKQRGTRNEYRAAFMFTNSLAAHRVIEEGLLAVENRGKDEGQKATSLSPPRDAKLLAQIERWEPIADGYLALVGPDLDAVTARMLVAQDAEGRRARVVCPIPTDTPTTQPAGRPVLMIDLAAIPSGGRRLWRVLGVGRGVPRPVTTTQPGPTSPPATNPAG